MSYHLFATSDHGKGIPMALPDWNGTDILELRLATFSPDVVISIEPDRKELEVALELQQLIFRGGRGSRFDADDMEDYVSELRQSFDPAEISLCPHCVQATHTKADNICTKCGKAKGEQ